MMPAFGRYDYAGLTAEQFASAVRDAHICGTLVSYVGYQQTADMISRLAGVPIPVSREQTDLQDGDILLIARLRYRMQNPATKGDLVPEDFSFGVAEYLADPGKTREEQ
jgi:hypothetical protein